MIVKKRFNYRYYVVDINLMAYDKPTKYIFVFDSLQKRIFLYGEGNANNHTILLRNLISSEEKKLFVLGGWVRVFNNQIIFYGKSRKYGNRIFNLRISELIQGLLFEANITNIVSPKSKRKLEQRVKKIDLLHRV